MTRIFILAAIEKNSTYFFKENCQRPVRLSVNDEYVHTAIASNMRVILPRRQIQAYSGLCYCGRQRIHEELCVHIHGSLLQPRSFSSHGFNICSKSHNHLPQFNSHPSVCLRWYEYTCFVQRDSVIIDFAFGQWFRRCKMQRSQDGLNFCWVVGYCHRPRFLHFSCFTLITGNGKQRQTDKSWHHSNTQMN